MRLLQINPNGSEETALDFHPMVTVVQGLDAAGRDLVLRVATSLPRAADPGVGGLLEAHGVLLDLRGSTLELLDLASEVDVVMSPADVPGLGGGEAPAPTGTAPADGGAGRADRAEIERFIEETPTGVHPALDKARQRRADAAEALAVLREALEKSRETYEPYLAELRRVEVALEKARREAASVAEQHEDETAEAPGLTPEQVRERRSELTAEIEELTERKATIEQGLMELSSIDTRPLTVLLDAINNPEPPEYGPSERAHELADEFVDLTHRIGEIEKDLSDEGLDSGSAMRRLEEARKELAAAEKAMQKPELTDEDVAELEAAHEAVSEAEKKATGLRKKSGERALEEARAKEQEILDRVGFPTWTSYVMGASLLGVDPAAEQRLERAQAEHQQAQDHWAKVATIIESNPEYRDLLNRFEEVLAEAHDLLGAEPEDVETALRELQVPKREVTEDELTEALAYQLELVGLDLGPDPARDLTVMAAEAFIEEAQAVEGRVVELREELGRVEAARTVAESDLADLPEEAEEAFESFDVEELGMSPGDETPAEDPLDVFLGRSGITLATDERVAELEAELATATEDELEYREWVESREALVDAALQVETVATSRLVKTASELVGTETAEAPAPPPGPPEGGIPDLEAIEFYVLGRQAALRDLSYAGSVPLVIDDALAELAAGELEAVLDKVDELADSVQVIYLSDDSTVAGWAERVGFARAAVVQAPPTFGR